MPDLKLLALDQEDLEIISAHTQDAVMQVHDLGLSGRDSRFACLINRYAWEMSGQGKGQRRRAVLQFDKVTDITSSGINLNAREGVIELLSVTFEPVDLPAGRINLVFAGGGSIHLHVECIEARLSDLGAAWSARAVPTHKFDED